MRLNKCRVCKIDEALYAWQPFGPQHDANCFSFLGAHYRGFMLIKICGSCKAIAQDGQPVEFISSKKRFIGNSNKVHEVPANVEDALRWWEEETTDVR